MYHQTQLIEACRQGSYQQVYDLINFPDVNIDDRGYNALHAAIQSNSSLITELLLNDSRTDPNHFNGQLFVDSLHNLTIVKQFLLHPEFNLNTVTIVDALLENEYDYKVVSLIFDDPRIVINRQQIHPERKLRINDVAAMDEDEINAHGITTQIRRLDDKFLSIQWQQYLAIDDLRYQLIVKLFEAGNLDSRDSDALRSQPDLFRLFRIDRFMISTSLDIGAVMVFDNTNRYHEAMLITVALYDDPIVLKALLSSVSLRVGEEIRFWKTSAPTIR
ncbi:Hypothetical protein POVR1_LOCUS487 [uncultured virus]|nr:Hypothetical protein POVR1_LOCUS487 [uncultured virus]